MKVKLVFNAQFCGYCAEIVDVPDNASDAYIKSLFPEVIGIDFDDNCGYEILDKKN